MRTYLITNLLLVILSIVARQTALSQQAVNVNTYTGRSSVRIPIWNVTSKGISHPVSLNYSSSGIRVGSGSGKAGMGWSVGAGGSITRVLQGLPDDINTTVRKGWLHGGAAATQAFVPSADQDYTDASDEAADYAALDNLGGFTDAINETMYDTRPDLFYINVPGIGGMFLFDENGNVATMPMKDMTIIRDVDQNTDKITAFHITTVSGTTYHFGLTTGVIMDAECDDPSKIDYRKNDYYYFEQPVSFVTTWYLTGITSLYGGQITFEYDQPRYEDQYSSYHVISWHEEKADSVSHWVYDPDADDYKEITQYYFEIHEDQPYTLRAIHGDGYTVRIEDALKEVPYQFVPNPAVYTNGWVKGATLPLDLRRPLVNEIKIFEHIVSEEYLIKKFICTYEFYRSYQYPVPLEPGAYTTTYPLLKSVTESTGTYMAPPYRFDYYGLDEAENSIFLPQINANQKDFFGYFSAHADNSIAYPELFVYPDEPAGNRFRHLLTPDYNGKVIHLPGRNTNPDDRGLLAGVLSSVTFPAGGNESFIYEPNTYFDPITGRDEYGGGLRVKELHLHDGIDHNKDMVTR